VTLIDVHNHFYPSAYLDALRAGPTEARIWTDREHNPVIGYPGDFNVVVRGHRDIRFRADAGAETMNEFWLMPLVGFLFETTLAAARLVFSGMVERYPRIQWILGHLGGAIP
jgi:hypothetical protein